MQFRSRMMTLALVSRDVSHHTKHTISRWSTTPLMTQHDAHDFGDDQVHCRRGVMRRGDEVTSTIE